MINLTVMLSAFPTTYDTIDIVVCCVQRMERREQAQMVVSERTRNRKEFQQR